MKQFIITVTQNIFYKAWVKLNSDARLHWDFVHGSQKLWLNTLKFSYIFYTYSLTRNFPKGNKVEM